MHWQNFYGEKYITKASFVQQRLIVSNLTIYHALSLDI